ncbi:hypothetical protein NC796_15850 [Aliifodinibius sp. S!AR15-10]|uniref:copper amine oxidase n=1 Tax=Aliifodinibius sp. S!AR15-10 TaxID=2950437 RepID=UPI002863BA45|nr:hypothetical protein [Aliifodinibius sp. S!AR15-10]MDR8392630.1 hypothetical protein [Aliifodinibius sp. S!AR15-10]
MKSSIINHLLITVLLLLLSIHTSHGQVNESNNHPLDPLSAEEIKTVRSVLEKAGKIDTDRIENHEVAFGMIFLNEPDKHEVLAYEKGEEFTREAFASIYDYPENRIYEAIVDLNSEKLVSYELAIGKQPVGTFEMDSIATEIALEDPRIQQALIKREVNADEVEFGGDYAADMSLNTEGNRELIVSASFKDTKISIRGLYAHVDLSDRKVLKVIDEGDGYSEKTDLKYFDPDSLESTLPVLNPVIIEQPDGVNYTIRGHQVTTPYWKFRYGIHNREGLVIYDVQYFDPFQKEWRYIMYRGSIAEMVVNYGSPELDEASNNYFDQGEYRFFQEKNRPLNAGADAPENATYIDAVVHDDMGNPVVIDSAVAIFEGYGGALWRHEKVGRRATNLSIKYYITAGNYDYGFEWIFKEDGTIQVNNELQGIVHIHSVDRKDDHSFPDDEHYNGSPYGVVVHPNVEANNHQHWHVWRLDLDVDGLNNTVEELNNIAVPPGPGNPYRNAIVAQKEVLETEHEAMRDSYAPSSRRWRVLNNDKEGGKFGQNPSYVLVPKQGTVPLALEGSSLSNRARVLWHHFWVTPYEKDEIYPAGLYPPSDQQFAGLPEWTKKNRDIKDTDVVLWYVMGKSHIVRPEDWPIMNKASMSFKLVPWAFFGSNPVWGKPPVHEKILESMKPGQPGLKSFQDE